MFEDIQKHRQAVRENIEKSLQIGFTESEDFEKAHQVGDIHPNGKWVWTQLPSGKFDWRVIKKKDGQGTGASAAQPAATQKPAVQQQVATQSQKKNPAELKTIKIDSRQDVRDLIKKIKSKKVTIGIRGNQRRDGSYDIVGRVTGGDHSFWDNGHLETNGGQLNIKWLGNGELEKRKFYSYRALQKFLESGDVQISYK